MFKNVLPYNLLIYASLNFSDESIYFISVFRIKWSKLSLKYIYK